MRTSLQLYTRHSRTGENPMARERLGSQNSVLANVFMSNAKQNFCMKRVHFEAEGARVPLGSCLRGNDDEREVKSHRCVHRLVQKAFGHA